MKKARWIIQNNLIAENDRNQFQLACDKMGVSHVEVVVIPFSSELPEFPIDDEFENIYYGSTTFMNNIYELLNKPKGLFYNHETFSMENYINRWGEYMLNCDAKIMTVKEFLEYEDHGQWDRRNTFFRPDGDGKEFDGQVCESISDLKTMVKRMLEYDNKMTMESKVLLGPAYNLYREWRNYIVDGKVVTSSRYRDKFRLSKSGDDIPEDMIKFVEERCKEYAPHSIFAMDIAESRDDDGTMKYYIIECGCMNSVGFYHADINKYVEKITEWIEK